MSLHIKQLVETCVEDAGNKRRGQRRAAEILRQGLSGKNPTIEAKDVSFKALAEAMVVPEGETLNTFIWDTDFREAVDSSAFPIAVKYVTDSVAIPAYEMGMAGADALITDRGVHSQAGKDDIIKIPGVLSDLWPDRVFRGMPYTEGNLMEKYAEIQVATFGRIIGFTKYALLADDGGAMLRDAVTLAENAGQHRHQFIVESAADLAITATGQAADTNLYYEGTRRIVYSSDHSSLEEGSQTNDNLGTGSLTTAPTTALKTWYSQMALMKDLWGRPVNPLLGRKQLLVPQSLYIDAQVVTASPFQSDNMNNGITPRLFSSLEIIPSVVLDGFTGTTSTVNWYAGNFPKAHWWYWGWPFKVDVQSAGSDADFERDEALRIKESYRGGCGYVDYRYVYKSVN